MNGTKLWLLACLPLALAACGMNDTDAEEDDPTDGAAADTMAAATFPPPAPMDTAAGAAAPMTVQMSPVGSSGVSGQANLMENASQTQVAVQLTGMQPNSRHAGHVHQGTCDAPGSVVAPLPEITANSTGDGTATEQVAVPLATVMNGQHIIVYHEAGGNPGAPVVCGAIPGHSM
ncbi:MAG TPA: hypothetical protein VHG51_21260 [Longimicrobiaceae bacterium]|nr:hypothetical protein [Longimicrobiaceae bacterium]